MEKLTWEFVVALVVYVGTVAFAAGQIREISRSIRELADRNDRQFSRMDERFIEVLVELRDLKRRVASLEKERT